MRKTKGEVYDEKANFGRLFYGNVGGWHRDWLSDLALDIRDALKAFKPAVDSGEVTGFRDEEMRAHAWLLVAPAA